MAPLVNIPWEVEPEKEESWLDAVTYVAFPFPKPDLSMKLKISPLEDGVSAVNNTLGCKFTCLYRVVDTDSLPVDGNRNSDLLLSVARMSRFVWPLKHAAQGEPSTQLPRSVALVLCLFGELSRNGCDVAAAAQSDAIAALQKEYENSRLAAQRDR